MTQTDAECLAMLRQVVKLAPVPVFAIDHSGAFLLINDACLAMIGSPGLEHSIQYNAFSLPSIRAVGLDRELRRCLSGETVDARVGYVSMFGKPVTARVRAYPLRSEGCDCIIGAVAFAQPLETAPECDEAMETLVGELEVARTECRHVVGLRDQFLAMVSHELRTPLSPLVGYLEMFARGELGPLTGRQRKAVELLNRSTGRLAALVEQILSYTSQTIGRWVLSLEAVELAAAVQESLDLMAPLLDGRGITVRNDCTPGVTAKADRHKLAQVLTILLDNARKYSDEGGRVELRCQSSAPGRVVLELSNTGEPVPPEALSKLFEPFFQVEPPATRRHGGMGLGLAIAREIVAAHGGTIHAVAEPGFALTIRIELHDGQAEEGEAVTSPQSELVSPRVCLLDGNPSRGDSIEAFLAEAGYRVERLASSESVLSSLSELRPLALIIGIDEPANVGISMVRTLRAEGPNPLLPIFAITGSTSADHKAAALEAGATAVLHSPIDVRWLLRLIRSVHPAMAFLV